MLRLKAIYYTGSTLPHSTINLVARHIHRHIYTFGIRHFVNGLGIFSLQEYLYLPVYLLAWLCPHYYYKIIFLFFPGNEWLLDSQVITGDILDLSKPLSISTKLPTVMKDSNKNPNLSLSVWVYYCMEAGNACMMKAASFAQPLQISATPGEKEVTVALTHAFWKCLHILHATASKFSVASRSQFNFRSHLTPFFVLVLALEDEGIDCVWQSCHCWQKCI